MVAQGAARLCEQALGSGRHSIESEPEGLALTEQTVTVRAMIGHHNRHRASSSMCAKYSVAPRRPILTVAGKALSARCGCTPRE